jgi:hypothetical protein
MDTKHEIRFCEFSDDVRCQSGHALKIINLFNTGMATANNNNNYLLSVFPYNGSSRDKTTTTISKEIVRK